MAVPIESLHGLDAATLALLKADYIACLRAISVGQSYTNSNRTFTKANLSEVVSLIAAINSAENAQSGTIPSTTYADFQA